MVKVLASLERRSVLVRQALEVGKETVFVNAGWMTMAKTTTEERNPPFVVVLQLD